jgi:hypothetical protein
VHTTRIDSEGSSETVRMRGKFLVEKKVSSKFLRKNGKHIERDNEIHPINIHSTVKDSPLITFKNPSFN